MSKRDDIVSAALDIISEQGISALTLPVLFKRAHTGAGTFYHYFDDRSILINGVFEYCFNAINDELADIVATDLPPRAWFELTIKRLFEVYLALPREMNFLYSFVFARVMPERDFCMVIPSVALLTRIISAAQREGLIRNEPTAIVISRCVRAMMASTFLSYERGEYQLDDAAAKRFADSVWIALQAR